MFNSLKEHIKRNKQFRDQYRFRPYLSDLLEEDSVLENLNRNIETLTLPDQNLINSDQTLNLNQN